MKHCFVLVLCFVGGFLFAQDKDSLDLEKYTLYEADSLVLNLEEVRLIPKLQFENYDDKRYYYWFRRKVLRAYPYAVIAADRVEVLYAQLDQISSKRKRRRHVKKIQKYFEKEFTGQLKKLTTTEGRILIKLIHRQTGIVCYDLVKDFRSGWRAFWYNTTANIFKLSLKAPYDPEYVKEDYLIEDILQRSWRDNLIELEDAELNVDYFEISKKWDLSFLREK